MSVPAKTSTPRPEGEFGVDYCSGCGRPPRLVGELGTHERYPGICRYCSHDLARYDVLAAELKPLITEWVAACLERGVLPRDVREVIDEVTDDLVPDEPYAPPAHQA